jgi:hypothetical protein
MTDVELPRKHETTFDYPATLYIVPNGRDEAVLA